MHKLFHRVRRLPGGTPVSRSRLARSLKSAVPVLVLTGLMLVGWSPDAFAISDSDSQALLNAHNAYRSKHCVPALTWSSQLAAEAQQWADACSKTHSGGWTKQPPYGENLSWGTDRSAQAAVDSWYSEISQYNFNAPSYSNAVGHFTQLVWRDSKQLGCGMAVCNGQNYWVCQYSPPGNWNTDQPGVLAANVPAICAAGGGGGGGNPPPPPPPPPPVANEWSAFAASPKGYWGYAVFKATEQQAKDLAFNGCGGNKNGCQVFWTTKDTCVSFAESRAGGYWYAAGGGADQNQAKQKAIQFCQSGTAPANSCKPTGAWCR